MINLLYYITNLNDAASIVVNQENGMNSEIYVNVFQPLSTMEWPETEISEIFPNLESQTECLFPEFYPTQLHWAPLKVFNYVWGWGVKYWTRRSKKNKTKWNEKKTEWTKWTDFNSRHFVTQQFSHQENVRLRKRSTPAKWKWEWSGTKKLASSSKHYTVRPSTCAKCEKWKVKCCYRTTSIKIWNIRQHPPYTSWKNWYSIHSDR